MSDKLEAQKIQKAYYGNPDGLAVHLTRICICRPGLVFEVFNLLDNFSKPDVGCQFYQKIDAPSLYRLASLADGLILCRTLYDILYVYKTISGVTASFPGRPDSCQNINLALLKHVIDNSATIGNEFIVPRQLSQCEMDYYADYNKSELVLWENIKKKYVARGGQRTAFRDEVSWQLPKQGTGYVVYNLDDLKNNNRAFLKDTFGYDQIGTKETVEAMMRIGKEWHAIYPHRLLQYGDISRPGGINTPDHKTHDDGRAFDVRPIRKDSQVGDSARLDYQNVTVYDQDLTKEFILLVRRLYSGTRFLFNDGAINQSQQFRSFVKPSTQDHDNHLHVIFPGGK